MLLLYYFICIHYTVLSINAFILHQSFLQILAYQILSVMLVLPFNVLGDLYSVRSWLLLIVANDVTCYVLIIQ